MSNEWITDRLPTDKDAHEGNVWITNFNGEVLRGFYKFVQLGSPWQPIQRPAPYVKPKTWRIVWINKESCWALLSYDGGLYGQLWFAKDEDDTIKKIEDIFNQIRPCSTSSNPLL
jgi:hypothetical protein